MDRQFSIRCHQHVKVERAFEWSNQLRVTTQTGIGELRLSQPADGTDVKTISCPHCKAHLEIVIRSETATQKRRMILYALAAIILSVSLWCWVMLFKHNALAYFMGATGLMFLAIPITYLALSSQIRATIHKQNGEISLPFLDDVARGHELSEI